jgi:uroporphyrinogen decarboxylase
MRSKERVLMAMNHQEPDRVPMDYGALYSVTQRLCEYLGVDPTYNPGSYQCYPEALLQRLHVDIRIVRPHYLGPSAKPLPDGGYVDGWGVVISKEGYPIGHPLAEAQTVADIYAHPFPDPDAYDYEHYGELCDQFADYAVCGGDWSPFFTWSLELMGTEQFLLSLRERPEVANALLTRVADYYFETTRRMFEAAKGKIDIFFMGDDYGTQRCPFVHPRDFRTFMIPQLTRLYGLAKSYGLKIMQHSCGSVRPMLEDLLAIGLDALDPVQVRAEGMEMSGLKRDFGDRLTFHGSIDTQHTLPLGTPEDVRLEVLDRLRVAAPGGGLILCGSQDYIADIPLENIVTLYDTAFEYGSYPLLGRRSVS